MKKLENIQFGEVKVSMMDDTKVYSAKVNFLIGKEEYKAEFTTDGTHTIISLVKKVNSRKYSNFNAKSREEIKGQLIEAYKNLSLV